ARSEPFPVHPVVEAEPTTAERVDEPDSYGWTAFEEAQEPSDAMTIIGAPAVGEEAVEKQEESAAEPDVVAEEPVAESEPEPEAAPHVPVAEEPAAEPRRRWWRRGEHAEEHEPSATAGDEPRHVRILPPDERGDHESQIDPWEQGFDDDSPAPAAEADVGEDTAEGEPALAVERDESERQ